MLGTISNVNAGSEGSGSTVIPLLHPVHFYVSSISFSPEIKLTVLHNRSPTAILHMLPADIVADTKLPSWQEQISAASK